jgi:muramoyltetrapeptide carboxypeptidase LdcA involved in peptidoglycan recycling
MLLNAMLKENAGHPFSGPTLSQFLYAQPSTFKWLSKTIADNGSMPDVKLHALRPGACSGLACGGHITLVLKGVRMGWAVDTKDRIVFLETTVWEPEKTRAMLDELVSKGYFKECAGVVFGDMGQGKARRSGMALKDWKKKMVQVRKDLTAKVTCPVYEEYPYGHIAVSYTIDFLRRKTITADGILKQ